jgi:hypothetical protein
MPSDHTQKSAGLKVLELSKQMANLHEKIPILLTVLWYLNSGTNNKNFILAIFFSSDFSYSSLITKNHSASDITWPIPAKIEAGHNHALTHTHTIPLL